MQPSDLAKAALALSPLLPPVLIRDNGTLVSLGIVALALIFVPAARGPTLALAGGNWRSALALGLGAGLALTAAFALVLDPLVEAVFGAIDLEDFAGVHGDFGKYLLLLALGLLFGGVLEEVVFRGFVIGWGTALLGERAAIWLVLLSASVFGLAHIYQGWAGVVSTGLAGLALGLVYLRGGRVLLPAVLVHMTLNFFGVTAIYLGLD